VELGLRNIGDSEGNKRHNSQIVRGIFDSKGTHEG